MGSEVGGPPPGLERHWIAPTLESHQVLRVRVCSFTFEFHSFEQLQACPDFYSLKILPSSRADIGGASHWEAQRWYERLPMYLREEKNRVQVVSALEKALEYARERAAWS
jgi:hypothetical protein